VNAERLPELFARALELDPAARAALLAETRATDAELAGELARLLAASEVDWEVDRSPWRAAPFAAAPPERIGAYRIVRELGRGGMGRVFLAEEETADFRRTVALKIIDRPTDDAESVRRFRTEVRILASLEHPGIARFLSGGRSPEGIWHLALEYVEGENLVRHAERLALDVRARVALFLQVLDSMSYAHGRGVVHRDLKPGHLIVGADGRTRLLDFGISRLLDSGGEAAGITVTRTEARAMTPAYASPEQFRGEPAAAASDVYSLGVILYELLAGRRPFDGTSPVELERAVLESEPTPPSTAVRTAATGSASGGTAPPDRPQAARDRGVDRDLDEICLKALRKRPEDRYPSAAAMAEDLRRFLDGRPVQARRGGRRYRFARLVRRQRGRLALAGASAVAIAGLVAALFAWREAERLRSPEPPEPRPFPLARVTERPVAELEREFAAAPESVEAGAALAFRLRYADRIDEAALVLARMRQIPGKEDDPLCDFIDGVIAQQRDQPQRALALYTRARDAALAEGRGELVAKTRASRGRILVTLGQREEGVREMELAFADHELAGDTLSAAQVLNNLAIESLQQGDYVRGEEQLEGAYSRFRQAGTGGAIVLRNLAELGLRRGRPDEAERWAEESLAAAGSDRRKQGRRIWVLGEALAEQGRTAEALPLLEESIGYSRADRDEPDLAYALFVRGRIEVATARFDRLAETVSELESLGGSGLRTTLMASRLLQGLAAAARGDTGTARALLAEGRRLQVEEGEPVLAAATDVDRALVELASGDRASAERLLADPAIDSGRGSLAGALAELLRARLDAESGRVAEARHRLTSRGDSEATTPSLRLRLAFLRARAALAVAEGRGEEARRDWLAAAEAARAAGWLSEELPLRLDAASLDGANGTAERTRIAEEARKSGLSGVAQRALI
jgi:serine/threonine-protein kinase